MITPASTYDTLLIADRHIIVTEFLVSGSAGLIELPDQKMHRIVSVGARRDDDGNELEPLYKMGQIVLMRATRHLRDVTLKGMHCMVYHETDVLGVFE
jgi:co-chaperonin GroES (HSP10)